MAHHSATRKYLNSHDVESGAPAALEGGMATIFIVDDDPRIARALQRELRRDFAIEVASDAVDALAKVGSLRPDLVLSDFRMPEMDGVDFLAEVRRRVPEAKRVLISGYADLEAATERLESAEIALLLRKPWGENISEVLSRVLRVVT